ncbi:hypothetical protein K7I13_01325 [Brucepastera parasyntrophica]|uniref:hypothetical protein n=1 Tax=Brucepastera parasyntrophica TaxID=2880008 RepID=UPI002108D01E|nr:hypothetical protein [Brucepastera parasyntrophica]ULQ60004.1 hypothetical protein K7I13_01325 [Brucepastera parasyntrophica]
MRQKGASSPRQFVDLPDPVAKQAVNIAPPLEWRFMITPDQKVLVGNKRTVLIHNDGKNILSMEGIIVDEVWTRN